MTNIMDNIFSKAFGRERNKNLRNPNRELRDLGNALNEDMRYVVYFQTAIDNYYSNDFNNAVQFVNNAISVCPFDHWRHFAFRGNIFEEVGQYEDAIQDYVNAIDIYGNDIYVYALYHQIGWCFLNLKNDTKAVEFYTYAIELKKLHPNNEYNEDLEGMDNGVVVGKEFKQMYVNRGNSLKNIGKLDDARKDCLEAINLDKNYSNPYLLLHQIFDKANIKDKALLFLETAAEMGNQNAIRMLKQYKWEVGINQYISL